MSTITVYDDESWKNALSQAKAGDQIIFENDTPTDYSVSTNFTIPVSVDVSMTSTTNFILSSRADATIKGTLNTNGATISRVSTANDVTVYSGGTMNITGGNNSLSSDGIAVNTQIGGTVNLTDTNVYSLVYNGSRSGGSTGSIINSGIASLLVEVNCIATIRNTTVEDMTIVGSVTVSDLTVNGLLDITEAEKFECDGLTFGGEGKIHVGNTNALNAISNVTFLNGTDLAIVGLSGTMSESGTLGKWNGLNTYQFVGNWTLEAGAELILGRDISLRFLKSTAHAIIYGVLNTNGATITRASTNNDFIVRSGGTMNVSGGNNPLSRDGIVINAQVGSTVNLTDTNVYSLVYKGSRSSGSTGTIKNSNIAYLSIETKSVVTIRDSTVTKLTVTGDVTASRLIVDGLLDITEAEKFECTGLTLGNDAEIRIGNTNHLKTLTDVTFPTGGESSPVIGLAGTMDESGTLEKWQGIDNFNITGNWSLSAGAELTLSSDITLNFLKKSADVVISGTLNTNGANIGHVSSNNDFLVKSGGTMNVIGGDYSRSSDGLDITAQIGGKVNVADTNVYYLRFNGSRSGGATGTIRNTGITNLFIGTNSSVKISESTVGTLNSSGKIELTNVKMKSATIQVDQNTVMSGCSGKMKLKFLASSRQLSGNDFSMATLDFSSLASDAEVDLSGNYWGTEDLDKIKALFGDYADRIVINSVLHAAPGDFHVESCHYNGQRGCLEIAFTQPLSEANSFADLVQISDRDGSSKAITGFSVSDRILSVFFNGENAVVCSVSVSQEIQDAFGNKLDQNCNMDGGESEGDDYSGVFPVSENEFKVSGLALSKDTVSPDELLNVNFNVSSAEGISINSSWTAGVYLSSDNVYDSSDLRLGYVSFDSLEAESTQNVQLSVNVPVPEGSYYLIVRADISTAAKENNSPISEKDYLAGTGIRVDAEEIGIGDTKTGTLTSDQTDEVYRIEKESGSSAKLQLQSSGNLTLYVGYGAVPTREAYSEKISLKDGDTLLLPRNNNSDIYVMVSGKNIKKKTAYTLTSEYIPMSIISVSPAQTSADQKTYVEVTGMDFTPDTRIWISVNNEKTLLDTQYVSSSFLTATVDAGTLFSGEYSVGVENGAASLSWTEQIVVQEIGQSDFVCRLNVPERLGYHAISEFSFEYSNQGTAAMDAPLIFLTVEQSGRQAAVMTLDGSLPTKGFWTYNMPDGFSNTISFLATGENGSILQPLTDEQGTTIYWNGWQPPWSLTLPPFEFKYAIIDSSSTEPVDWGEMLKNMDCSEDYKTLLVKVLQDDIGTTMGDYVTMLNRIMRQMKNLGISDQLSASDLLKTDLFSVNGIHATVGTLIRETDIQLNTQGLSLDFRRIKGSATANQYQDGVLGFGWSTNWDSKLVVDEKDGTVRVTLPGGGTYMFEPAVEDGYVAFSNGVSLTSADGSYILTDSSKTKYGFSSNGRLSFVNDVNDNAITAVYSGKNLTRLNHSDGSFIAFTYDTNGHIATATGSNGATVTYTYDTSGNLTSVADAAGTSLGSYTYDQTFTHNLASFTARNGAVTRYTYDAYGRLAGSSIDGTGKTLTIVSDGAFSTITDQSGFSYTEGVDQNGKILRYTDSLGNWMDYTYDADGNLIKTQDIDGNIVSYSYDSKGHCLSVTDELNRTTSYTYSGDNVKTVTDCRSNVTTYSYNKKDQLIGISFADGTSCSMTYDDAGNLATSTDVNRIKTVMTYDEHGNMLSLSRNGLTYTYAYDGNGNLTSSTDPSGNTVSYEYNAENRVTGFTDANGNRIQYAYDNAGNLASVSYANGKSEQFVSDIYGNMTSWTNMRGETMNSTVDSIGQVTANYVAGEDRTFTYDARGLALTAGDMSFSYDRAGRLLSTSYADGRYVTYEYNTAGQLVSMSDETGNTTNYSYDIYGDIDRITDKSGSLMVDYDFNRLGQLVKQTNGNGTYTTWAYNAADDVERIGYYDASGNETGFCEYAYDDDNHCIAKTTGSGVWEYGYDKSGRLLSETFTDADGNVTQEIGYTYDAAGNRLSKTVNEETTTYAYNNMNQIVSSAKETVIDDEIVSIVFEYRYDADGNLLEDEERTYTWTKDNHVASETLKSTGHVWTYGYDALGNRTSVTTNGMTTTYTVDAKGNVLSEYVNGNQMRSYCQGLSLVGFTTADGAYYFNADQQGSTLSVTNAAGKAVNSYTYDAFGNVLSSTESVANDFEFVGGSGLMANASGTTFVRARNYDAVTGRWLSMDPIGINGGDNLYVYSGNDPVGYVDTDGKFRGWDFAKALGSTVLGVAGVAASGVLSATGVGSLLGMAGAVVSISAVVDGVANMVAAATDHEPVSSGNLVGDIGAFVGQSLYYNAEKGATVGNMIAAGISIADSAKSIFGKGAQSLFSEGYHFVSTDFNVLSLLTDSESLITNYDTLDRDFDEIMDDLSEMLDDEITESVSFSDICSSAAVKSMDPNDMIGPKGYGENHAVADGSTLTYTVMCENDPEMANAPVRWLRIKNTLDENLDLDTFTLDSIYIAGNLVKLDEGMDSYNQRITMIINGAEVLLDFAINLNYDTRELRIEVMAIDPDTDFMLQDTSVGFLYPNDETGIGDAYFVYSVKAKDGLADGTVIKNKADIYFDFNDVIPTPEYTNVIDDAAPTVETPVAAVQSGSPARKVSWSGSDGEGAGIAWYAVEIARNGGEWETLYEQTVETGVTITEAGSFRLRVKAVDALGFESGWSDAVEFSVDDTISSLPDLGFLQPMDWYAAAVISPDATLYAAQALPDHRDLYLSFIPVNYGKAASGPYSVETYLDGEFYSSIEMPALESEYYQEYDYLPIGAFAAGTHTVELRIVSDETDANPEDNVYTRTFTVAEDGRGTFYEVCSGGDSEKLDCTVSLSLASGKYVIGGDFTGKDEGRKVNAKVQIYNSVGKKVGSTTVKNGKIAANEFLLPEDDYEVRVLSSDKQKTADRVSFTVTGMVNYKANSADDRIADVSELPYRVTVRKSGRSLVAADWVGFGDVVDYRQIVLDCSGKYNFTVNASGQAKISLLSVSTNAKSKVQEKAVFSTSISGKKLGKDVDINGVLIEKGTYYLKVESTNAKKGGSSDYSILLNANSVFFDKGDNSDDWGDMKTAGDTSATLVDFGVLSDSTSTVLENEWVGFGDTTDYRKFTLNGSAKLSFSVTTNDTVKVGLYQLVSKEKGGVTTYSLKQVQATTFKSSGDTKSLLVGEGDYYLMVQSTNAKKGGAGADYSVALNKKASEKDGLPCTEFFPETLVDDNWTDMKTLGTADPTVGTFGSAKVKSTDTLSDWVGYGDAIDYKGFTVGEGTQLAFEVHATGASKFTVYELVPKKKGSKTTYSLKTLQSRTLVDDAGSFQCATAPIMFKNAGTYYFSMESTNAKKGGSAYYDVTVGILGGSSESVLAMPETDSLGISDALSFGGYDTDALADASASALADLDNKTGWMNISMLA